MLVRTPTSKEAFEAFGERIIIFGLDEKLGKRGSFESLSWSKINKDIPWENKVLSQQNTYVRSAEWICKKETFGELVKTHNETS